MIDLGRCDNHIHRRAFVKEIVEECKTRKDDLARGAECFLIASRKINAIA
jgi:hypothetical protein